MARISPEFEGDGFYYTGSGWVQPFWDEFDNRTERVQRSQHSAVWFVTQFALFGDEISGSADTFYKPNWSDEDA